MKARGSAIKQGMMQLSRRPNESIMIGDNIKITLLGISTGAARFGISAPRDVAVDREEVRLRKQAESAR